MSAGYVGAAHDFAFLVGQFTVTNRRLLERRVGSQDWDVFAGTFTGTEMLHGILSIDEMNVPERGFSGSSIRTLDVELRRWSIYWINSNSGQLQPPVHGGFNEDRGVFEGHDIDIEHPVIARFSWHRHLTAPVWSQAFSYDEGRSWETNWIMEFNRVPAPALPDHTSNEPN